MAKGLVAGVDLGGTKILLGMFDGQGRLLGERLTLTRPDQGFEAVFDRIVTGIEELKLEHHGPELEGIVVGVPGPLDHRTGLVYEAPNLKWREVPLGELMGKTFRVPVWVENDANLAALGEYTYGYSEEYEILLYLTVSTGIGGGIVISGEIYRGYDGGAGEFGHMTILPQGPPCSCGNRGCLESLASGTTIARIAREEVRQGRCSALREAAGGEVESIDARMVAEVAARGDPETRRILEEAIDYLGIGVANLVNLFNPRAVIIGGGVSGYPGMLERVRKVAGERAFARLTENLVIAPARLGARAGIMGCLAQARRSLDLR